MNKILNSGNIPLPHKKTNEIRQLGNYLCHMEMRCLPGWYIFFSFHSSSFCSKYWMNPWKKAVKADTFIEGRISNYFDPLVVTWVQKFKMKHSNILRWLTKVAEEHEEDFYNFHNWNLFLDFLISGNFCRYFSPFSFFTQFEDEHRQSLLMMIYRFLTLIF